MRRRQRRGEEREGERGGEEDSSMLDTQQDPQSLRSFSTFCGFVIGIQAAKHTSNRKTDKLAEQEGGRGEEGLLTTGVGAFFLSNSEGFIFGPQKRNAEQSGLTTIKVMLTNNPRRDWEGLTAARQTETERGIRKERGEREKCHRRTKS